ncbi:hypothetical protein ThidrDRAFT_4202 [Thiorhodococcus drewsii AZ1]|uniref:Uncharacterized protein n=1 Tax=Thiorhodococcus drewsii AZ1 TaxID=765913 RepID=G2E7D9_9GAMM|nr:hypothetical protein [Thiorhodococcus drewsii]EGV27978.1 hypothetical protein ThidrDRAFT_4202 [Thiorhodococcus drewsii AZ1]
MDILVREILKGDEFARLEVLDTATKELRRTYQPRVSGGRCVVDATGVLVALKGNTLVGTAEYILKDHHVYTRLIRIFGSGSLVNRLLTMVISSA